MNNFQPGDIIYWIDYAFIQKINTTTIDEMVSIVFYKEKPEEYILEIINDFTNVLFITDIFRK